MLTDEQFQDFLRDRLHGAVEDLVPRSDLAGMVRVRYRRRQVRRGAFGGGFVAIASALVLAVVTTVHPASAPTVQLAGYTVTLPAGSHAGPPLGQCTQVAVQLNVPPPGAKRGAITRAAVTSPSGTGCISGLLTWVYSHGKTPVPDPVAPSGAQPVQIGPYSALGLVYSNGSTFYVEVPAYRGGYQDLVVGAIDLPQAEVKNLAQQAVAAHLKAIGGSR
jgi:hypothetical protein